MNFYKAGDTFYCEFCTQDFTSGVATDADSLPVATANVNGADDTAFVLTVRNIDSGRYSITGTVPAYNVDDRVSISAFAIVGARAGKNVVAEFSILAENPAGVGAIWNALTSTMTTAGSIGKKLADWVISYVGIIIAPPPTPSAPVGKVWLYSNMAPRLKDWLNVQGGEVTDIVLDLINRATDELWHAAEWEFLNKTTVITGPKQYPTSYAIPVDCGKIIAIGYDVDNDGRLDEYLWRQGEPMNGYRVDSYFDKTTGLYQTIAFYYAASYNITIVYKQTLVAFTGVDVEYSFFPENLVVLQAQLIHARENNRDAGEYQIIEREYIKQLERFKASVQYVNSRYAYAIKDDNGQTARLPQQNLVGGQGNGRVFNNSFDGRNY